MSASIYKRWGFRNDPNKIDVSKVNVITSLSPFNLKHVKAAAEAQPPEAPGAREAPLSRHRVVVPCEVPGGDERLALRNREQENCFQPQQPRQQIALQRMVLSQGLCLIRVSGEGWRGLGEHVLGTGDPFVRWRKGVRVGPASAPAEIGGPLVRGRFHGASLQ